MRTVALVGGEGHIGDRRAAVGQQSVPVYQVTSGLGRYLQYLIRRQFKTPQVHF